MGEIPGDRIGGKTKPRAKKQFIKIDMTPMVDLAFLLLTFFILTTTLAEQRIMDVIMPVGGEASPVNNAVNIILSGDDRIFYYEGEWHAGTKLVESNFKKIRSVIAGKNKKVVEGINAYKKNHPGGNFNEDPIHINALHKIQEDAGGAFIIIKYDSLARYRNAVDIVDEMDVCGVPPGKYALVEELTIEEKNMLRDAKNN